MSTKNKRTRISFLPVEPGMAELCLCFDSAIIAIEKHCQHDIYKTSWATSRILIVGIQFRISV